MRASIIVHVDNKSSSRHNLPNAISILAGPATAVDAPMLNDMIEDESLMRMKACVEIFSEVSTY